MAVLNAQTGNTFVGTRDGFTNPLRNGDSFDEGVDCVRIQPQRQLRPCPNF